MRILPILWLCAAMQAAPLRVASFRVDATPPIGSPLCEAAVAPAAEIVDPLSARGIVLLGAGRPIVLVSVDWVEISNEGQDAWREALAKAAGTSPERVRVHVVHQHDAPALDLSAERLLERVGLGGRGFDPVFARGVIANAAAALREAVRDPEAVTHIGLGKARVEEVASNRRVLGPDGKVLYARLSSCRDPKARAAPEGVIDPYVRIVSFWNGARPLVSLTFYATHPQSYYGKGGVSADFVGMARAMRERELPGVAHIHFDGAGGDVAAGKYNDGSPEVRPVLAKRLAAGMRAAWANVQRYPIDSADAGWKTVAVALPLSSRISDRAAQRRMLEDPRAPVARRVDAARNLAWIERVESGRKMDLACLRLGRMYLLNMPSELFVEYELAAGEMRPNDFVATAAYEDCGPGYIGTRVAYSQGGYEPTDSRVAPEVEDVVMPALRELLR